jgi:hypothetical protein
MFERHKTQTKKGYEDLIRHKADWEVNAKKIYVLRNGVFKKIQCRDIVVYIFFSISSHKMERFHSQVLSKCGDIVQVECDSDFPCDLVLLYSNTETSTCHIKTSNLDGETNLKLRSLPFRFPRFSDPKELIDLTGVISCEKPNTRLYEFKGNMTIKENI